MDKKQQATVSRRLEPLGWRTTQREQQGDYEQRASAGKWGRIATSIINYQNKNRGMSPTDIMIAKDTGLTEGAVRYHLRAMEKAGLITDVKGWPRHIVVTNLAKVQSMSQLEVLFRPTEMKKPEEVKVVHSDEIQPKRRSASRKAFIVRAQQIAQAVVDHYDQYGTAPEMAWVAQRVYGQGSRSGRMSGVVKKMVDLGWLYHKNGYHHDMAVTGLGRAALFGRVEDQLHTDTPINPMPNKVQGERLTVSKPPETTYSPPPVAPQPRPSIPRQVTEERVYSVKPDPSAVSMFEDVDLVMELIRRGFKVSR